MLLSPPQGRWPGSISAFVNALIYKADWLGVFAAEQRSLIGPNLSADECVEASRNNVNFISQHRFISYSTMSRSNAAFL
jgi:hypothetical protein